jgi:glycosyltransferase involved in cell wall biosynthesis
MMAWTGIGTYTKNLLRELAKLDSHNQYIVLLLAKDYDTWKAPADNFYKQPADFKPYGFDEQLLLPILLYRLRADLVHFPHLNAPGLYLKQRIVTIHDLTLLTFPTARGNRFKTGLKVLALKLSLRLNLALADCLLVTSQATREALLAWSRRPALDKKIVQIPLGVSSTGRPDNSPSQPPRLLYVGNAYPHKNLDRLVEAFSLVAGKIKDLRLVLVINTAASDQAYYVGRLRALADQLGLIDRVEFKHGVNDDELTGLYSSATALVFPSLSEGFGLPPLEAMAHGLPVLASDASSIPDVCGEAAIYFDPLDVQSMADAIEGLINSPDELANLAQAGPKRAAKYSWTKTAQETLELYRKF